MPRPDHELIYATNIPDVTLRPGQRLAVITLVEVRSDKVALDADDQEQHTYGGAVRYVAHVLEGEAYEAVVRLAHKLGDGVEVLSLFDGIHDGLLDQRLAASLTIERTPAGTGEPIPDGRPQTPVQTVDDVDGWEDPPPDPATMAPVQVDDRPAQHVNLAHLNAVNLSPAAFYSAGRMLKLGRTLADVTEGWTDDQRAYLASFLASPTTTKATTPRKRAPRKVKP